MRLVCSADGWVKCLVMTSPGTAPGAETSAVKANGQVLVTLNGRVAQASPGRSGRGIVYVLVALPLTGTLGPALEAAVLGKYEDVKAGSLTILAGERRIDRRDIRHNATLPFGVAVDAAGRLGAVALMQFAELVDGRSPESAEFIICRD